MRLSPAPCRWSNSIRVCQTCISASVKSICGKKGPATPNGPSNALLKSTATARWRTWDWRESTYESGKMKRPPIRRSMQSDCSISFLWGLQSGNSAGAAWPSPTSGVGVRNIFDYAARPDCGAPLAGDFVPAGGRRPREVSAAPQCLFADEAATRKQISASSGLSAGSLTYPRVPPTNCGTS